MRTPKIIAVGIFGLATLLSSVSAQEKDEFVLNFPSSVDTNAMAVDTFLPGSFGGLGKEAKIVGTRCTINVEKTDSLKAIVFSPHHQLVLIDVPSLRDDPLRSVDISLKPLRSLRFAGRVLLPPGMDGTHFRLNVRYVWDGGMNFMGYIDGMPPQPTVADTVLSQDGSFQLEVPDVWNDPSVHEKEGRGSLWLCLFPIVGKYSPDDARQTNGRDSWNVPIAAKYKVQKLEVTVRSPHAVAAR